VSVAGQLFRSASEAYGLRAYGVLEHLSRKLVNCGLRSYAGKGHHLLGLQIFRYGDGDTVKALWHFEQAMRLCQRDYRARVLLSIGRTFAVQEGDDSKYIRACELVCSLSDPLAVLQARQALAIADAEDGKHSRALARLLDLIPMTRSAGSALYIPANLYNSIAEEFTATGNLEAAKQASDEAMSSPYAPAYSEWKETAIKIDKRMSRKNVVAFRSPGITAEEREFGAAFYDHTEFMLTEGQGLMAKQVRQVTDYARGLLI
jgi:hypothetical protein